MQGRRRQDQAEVRQLREDKVMSAKVRLGGQ